MYVANPTIVGVVTPLGNGQGLFLKTDMNKARNKDRLTSPIVKNRLKWIQLELDKHMRISYIMMMQSTYDQYVHYLENTQYQTIHFNNGNRIG